MRNLLKGRARFVLALVALLVAIPAVASASHVFDDVSNNHPFHNDIAWLAEKGVTQGCDTQNYCPDKPVTRGQMAAMLHRFADNVVPPASIGVSGYERVSSTSGYGQGTMTHSVDCPPGKVVTGGGVESGSRVEITYPKDDNTWEVSATYPFPTTWWNMTVWAICVTA